MNSEARHPTLKHFLTPFPDRSRMYGRYRKFGRSANCEIPLERHLRCGGAEHFIARQKGNYNMTLNRLRSRLNGRLIATGIFLTLTSLSAFADTITSFASTSGSTPGCSTVPGTVSATDAF